MTDGPEGEPEPEPKPGPEPGPETALAVVATTSEVLAHPDLDEALLAPWERRRLAGIRLPSRRDDVLAARLLLRLCVARATGLPPDTPALAQRCPGCGEHGHGRPYLRGRPGVGVSLSHADGLVAAAVGPGAIGIDVEPATRRPGPLHVLRRLLPDADVAEAAASPDAGAALLRLWVRAEARLKAGQVGETGWSGQTGLSGQSRQSAQGDIRLLDWTDRPRAAVAAAACATRVTIASL
ncbi:4'-phosphopantetheinyl transferase superfamily protein [Streptomyces sp. NPDC013489]|uniref:4'-phosphopantetheinyl transferase family protein n=1 Tax=Streptomyces sp. NPDC013489 TaxID=3155606 RepID=UPI0033C1B351